MLEANKAALAAFSDSHLDGETAHDSVPSVDCDAKRWQVDRTVENPTDVGVGDAITVSKGITDDVTGFAYSSGDTTRLRLDEEFDPETRFGEPIVHGTLAAG